MQFFILWLIIINAVGIWITIHDKRAAQQGKWRISERTLFLVCILGGSPAVYITMRAIHHKTRHKRFMVGIPVIFVMQGAIAFFLCYHMN